MPLRIFLYPPSKPIHSLIVASFLITQAILLFLWFWFDERHFVDLVRDVGLIGIIFAAIYKELIWLIQWITPNKNTLDRAWLWQTQATAVLFLYAAVAWATSLDDEHPILFAILWFEIWSQIAISASFVLYYLYIERFLPVLRACRVDDRFCGFRNLYAMLRGQEIYD